MTMKTMKMVKTDGQAEPSFAWLPALLLAVAHLELLGVLTKQRRQGQDDSQVGAAYSIRNRPPLMIQTGHP